jgi:hypothetical protein
VHAVVEENESAEERFTSLMNTRNTKSRRLATTHYDPLGSQDPHQSASKRNRVALRQDEIGGFEMGFDDIDDLIGQIEQLEKTTPL